MIWYEHMTWHDMIWAHDMTWHDMIWYDIIWAHDMTWYMIWYDTIRHDTTRHDTTRHDTTRHDMIWYNVVLCYVNLCYVNLCYAMLCYVILHYIIYYIIFTLSAKERSMNTQTSLRGGPICKISHKSANKCDITGGNSSYATLQWNMAVIGREGRFSRKSLSARLTGRPTEFEDLVADTNCTKKDGQTDVLPT